MFELIFTGLFITLWILIILRINKSNKIIDKNQYIRKAYKAFIENNPKDSNIYLDDIDDSIFLTITNSEKHDDVLKINLYLDNVLVDVAAYEYNFNNLYEFNEPYKDIIEEKIFDFYEDYKIILPELNDLDNQNKRNKFIQRTFKRRYK